MKVRIFWNNGLANLFERAATKMPFEIQFAFVNRNNYIPLILNSSKLIPFVESKMFKANLFL